MKRPLVKLAAITAIFGAFVMYGIPDEITDTENNVITQGQNARAEALREALGENPVVAPTPKQQ